MATSTTVYSSTHRQCGRSGRIEPRLMAIGRSTSAPVAVRRNTSEAGVRSAMATLMSR